MDRRRRTFAALVVAAVLLAGCAPQFVTVTVTTPPETLVVTATPLPSPTPDPVADRGPNTLAVCLVGEPDTLYLYGDSRLPATRHVMEALYDGPIDYVDYTYRPVILQKLPRIEDGDATISSWLVREGDLVVDADGEVVELAEGVQVYPFGCYAEDCVVEFEEGRLWLGRMEVTFALREGLTWADGEPLTAADSTFAFRVASDPATPGRSHLVERTTRYQHLDDHHVRWVGLPGFIPHTYFLNFFAPLPRHQLRGRSPARLVRAEETRRAPLGWGPFVVEEWVPGDYLALSRNPHYFRAEEGLPSLDGMVFKFTTGAAEMIADLLAGQCDVAVHDGDFEPSMPLLVQAERQGLIELVSSPGTTWEQVDFGIAPVSDYGRADFFGDERVRQAIAQCIDRQALVDEVTYGRGVVPDSVLSPGHPLYVGDALVPWDYDPSAAQALLEEVGWLDDDEDGVREARGVEGIRTGTPFEVTLLAPSDRASAQQVARMIRANLADCGIQVERELLPSWQLTAGGPDGPVFGRQFDLAQRARRFDFAPSCEDYVSWEIPGDEDWGGRNPSGYSSAEYDQVCEAALAALPGIPEHARYHEQVQTILAEDLPVLPLLVWPRVAVARPGVLNFTLDSTAPSELWNVERIALE